MHEGQRTTGLSEAGGCKDAHSEGACNNERCEGYFFAHKHTQIFTHAVIVAIALTEEVGLLV